MSALAFEKNPPKNKSAPSDLSHNNNDVDDRIK